MSRDSSSFIDLRLSTHAGPGEDSFWPSFTDIMTTVVIIFVMVMVVLVIRNTILMNQLRSTLEAERSAQELARVTGEEKESLALQLMSTETEISKLRAQVLRSEQQRQQQELDLSSQARQLASAMGERDQLSERSHRLNDQVRQLQDALAGNQHSLEGLRQEISRAQGRYESANQELESLRRSSGERERLLTEAQARVRDSDQRLLGVQRDYADLKVKYDKLIRPARSPQGRYVVEVRYTKGGRIELKTQEESEARLVSRAEVDDRLAQLKKQHGNGLYVKVVFPDNSGLSFNEAWQFTAEMHKKYDYYFQDGLIQEPGVKVGP